MAFLDVHYYSTVLGRTCAMSVLLPEEDQGIGVDVSVWDGKSDLPVLYLLHGMGDDHTIWSQRTSIARYVAGRRLAVVMPSAEKSNYVDQHTGEKYYTFLTEELPQIVSSLFRISTKREDSFIAGLSMGGYGAMRAALGAPHRYAAAASMSGGLDLTQYDFDLFQRYSAGEPLEQVTARKRVWARLRSWRLAFGSADEFLHSDNNLMALLEKRVQEGTVLPRFHISIGTEDLLYHCNQTFCQKLTELGVEYQYDEKPGAHQWSLWDECIQMVLDWLPIEKV